MSQFDSGWLSVRRERDHASRAAPPGPLCVHLEKHRRPLEIVDLGAGTGSNAAYLASHLPGPQRWRLVEQDLAHRSQAQLPGEHDTVFDWRAADLAADLPGALSGALDLITASAFLDLVSARWIDELVLIGAERRAGFLIALTYDGIQGFCPPLPQDADIVGLFNRHQRTDKGFGPALGPTATCYLRERLQDAGYQVETTSTPWKIGPGEAAFVDVFLTGVVKAAVEMAPGFRDRADRWLETRLQQAQAGELILTVGHQDLFAWP
ncbi:MAG: class I SAM-dependent methyltransferase [Pseudomonadota bacterium]